MGKFAYIILILSVVLGSCTQGNNEQQGEDGKKPTIAHPKSLNITILLDLSDRLTRPIVPSQKERDIEIVKTFIDAFKVNVKEKGVFAANSKIKVLFKPTPNDPNINSIARNLNIDLEGKHPKQKKDIYNTVEEDFVQNLDMIYEETLKSKEWIGSDIWRFFKYDAKDLTIINDDNFRNILVILTDGYIYHNGTVRKSNNKSSFLTNKFLKNIDIYDNSDWKSYLETNDYGLISVDQKLENLEVLFLEINPIDEYIIDEEIIRWYVSNWLQDMKVQDFRIYNTALIPNTKTRINNFLK